MDKNLEKFKSKWNQRYVNNLKGDKEFTNNNRGLSHLTSPMNYVNNEEIKSIVKSNKAFLLNSIENY